MRLKQTFPICQKILLFLLISRSCVVLGNVVSLVKSPDNSISIELLLNERNTLQYRVLKGSQMIVSASNLGINTSMADFSSGLVFEKSSLKSENTTYSLPSGKRSLYLNKYNELKATFSKSGEKMDLIVRVYDDGFAYRYAIDGNGKIAIHTETSECKIMGLAQIYSQIYTKDNKNIVESTDWDLANCTQQHMALPLLLKTENSYLLLSEAMVNENYAGSQIITTEETGAFEYQFIGSITAPLPFLSPWRTIMMGSLNTIVESTLIENLNPPTSIANMSWIKPGWSTWSYAGEDTSTPLSFDNIRKYIDWTSEMGWAYFMLDRGWQSNSSFTLDQVINYANSKNVALFIWVNQNSLPTDEVALRSVLLNWKNKGVRGLTIDFWENESQSTLKKYDLLFRLTAEYRILLDIHSCAKPTGIRRTWPHLLTSEAVLNNAYYAKNPAIISSQHNINSAVIRTALGSTDYYPIDFANKNGRILYGTTWAHQLSLSVIFESGIQHLGDAPENIKYHIAKDFLKNQPVSWDNTQCLEAELDKYITLVRRKGEDWYLASLNADARTFETALSFLPSGKTFNAYIYKDGDCPSEIKFEYKENLKSTDKLSLELLANGGFSILFSPSASYAKPLHQKYEAESTDNIIPFGVAVRVDQDSLCSGRKYVASIGKGRALTFQKIKVQETGTYALTFYYMADRDCVAYVKLNGKSNSLQEYTFINTGGFLGSALAHKTIFVELNAAVENKIEIGNEMEYAPNIDRITITKYENTETDIETPKMDENEGTIYASQKNIVIKQPHDTYYAIYDVLGQLLTFGQLGEDIISIPMNNSGIYIVKLRSNKKEFSKKVIIQ